MAKPKLITLSFPTPYGTLAQFSRHVQPGDLIVCPASAKEFCSQYGEVITPHFFTRQTAEELKHVKRVIVWPAVPGHKTKFLDALLRCLKLGKDIVLCTTRISDSGFISLRRLTRYAELNVCDVQTMERCKTSEFAYMALINDKCDKLANKINRIRHLTELKKGKSDDRNKAN